MFDDLFTQKQLEVLNYMKEYDPRLTICYGAKRAGKTFVLNLAYLEHIAEFEDMDLAFIIGGTSYASIFRNVLNDWKKLLGIKKFKFNEDHSINILGNRVYIFNGSNAGSFQVARGFTAFGCFLNEATTLHETFVQECITRCSGKNARIFIDTNPENPLHSIKLNYIDKTGSKLKNGRINIKAFHFTLDDNDKLDEDYIQSIKDSTPTGVFYDRDILGRWVNAEGVVYRDFNANKHIMSTKNLPTLNGKLDMVRIWGGIDWGYKHKGSIVILGIDKENKLYVLEEYTKDLLLIDSWVAKAKEFIQKYGNITFYADSARPEHVVRFRKENIKCLNANKSVKAGIETVSKLLVQDRLLIVKENVMDLPKEFNLYVWGKDDEPIKMNDDAIDALRYAVYSDYLNNKDVYFPLLTEKPKNYRAKYYI